MTTDKTFRVSPKKILFISPLPPPAGGIATWTKEILQFGLSNNYEPFVVNTQKKDLRRPNAGGRSIPYEIKRNGRILSSLVGKIFVVRPDIVHINSCLSPLGIYRDLLCAILARIFHTPVVVHYRGNIPDFPGHGFLGAHRLALKTLSKTATANIALNVPSHLHLVNSLHGGGNVYKIPNFTLPSFIKGSDKNHNANTGSKYRIVYVGAVMKSKGCGDIIEVAKKVPEAEFVFVGDVVEADFCNVKTQPTNTRFLGCLNQSEIIDELYRSDVFLCLSKTEGFPISVLEAMSAGLPVIATKVGAIPEMIDHGQGGLLVDAGDTETIISHIKALKNNPQLRAEMGNYNAAKAMDNYSYSRVIGMLTALYDEILSRPAP